MKQSKPLKFTSIFIYEIKNSVILITVVLTFMTFLVTSIIYKVIDNHIVTILDRTLVVAWAEYNQFFQETKDSFALIRKNADINYVKRIIPQYGNSSFWLIIEDGKVIDANGNSASSFTKDLLDLFVLSKEKTSNYHHI